MQAVPENLLIQIFEKSAACMLFRADAPDFTIVMASDAYLAATGLSRAQLVGKGAFTVFQDDPGGANTTRNAILESIATKKKVHIPEYSYAITNTATQAVEEFWWSSTFDPIIGDDGAVVYVMGTAIDLTEKVRSRRMEQSLNDTLKLAMETANMGTWDANLVTDTMSLAERSRLIHGIPDDRHPTLMEAAEMIPEQDRKRVLNTIFDAVNNHGKFDIQYQIQPMDGGKSKWIRSTGMGYYDTDGKPISILGTIFDITEQKEDELRKNDFIGMVSHELKTPLTTLSAIVQLANAKMKNSPDTFLSGAMTKAAAQVKKMSQMINGFLNVSRLESGKIMIEKATFNLDDMLQEIIAETELTASGTAFHYDACTPVIIEADRDKIGSVVANLLSNAIKYAPHSKIIDIKCATENGMAIVSVRDYGMGVKRQDREKLFDRFYRVENMNNQHIAGFGIGLYLSAEIIHRHEGKIWVESEYGFGSTFYFSLPLKVI